MQMTIEKIRNASSKQSENFKKIKTKNSRKLQVILLEISEKIFKNFCKNIDYFLIIGNFGLNFNEIFQKFYEKILESSEI